MLKINKIFLIVFLFLIVSSSCKDGCSCNGCTSRKVIDTEKETRKIDGIKIKITANKIRNKNRRITFRSRAIKMSKNTWYSINYNVKISRRPVIKNLCEFSAEKETELKPNLKKFNIKFSPDKQHFAVGIDDVVWDFWHLLEDGTPFPSDKYYFTKASLNKDEMLNLKFSEIDWTLFPKSYDLLDTLIIQEYIGNGETQFLELLQDMPIGNKHEILLINNWYCPIANKLFTKNRVEKLIKKSTEWKKVAIAKILNILKSEHSYTANNNVSNSINLLLDINDENSLRKADVIIFKTYSYDDVNSTQNILDNIKNQKKDIVVNNFQSYIADKYFLDRLDNKDITLDADIKNKIIEISKNTINNFPKKDKIFSNKASINFLLKVEEKEVLKQFLEKNITAEIINDYNTNVLDLTISNSENYPEDLQKIMVNKYTQIMLNETNNFNYFNLRKIFEFLEERIPCKDSKQIYEKHKSELSKFKMKRKCK